MFEETSGILSPTVCVSPSTPATGATCNVLTMCIPPQLQGIIDQIIELHRRRQLWHRAEKSLTLTAKASCRRLCAGDKKAATALYAAVTSTKTYTDETDASDEIDGVDQGTRDNHNKDVLAVDLILNASVIIAPLLQSRHLLAQERKRVEKEMTSLAGQLPVASWVISVRGLGLLGLAQIVGEAAAPLSAYATVAKLWKRFGLAVMPDGTRQRKVTDVEAALEHGYSPSRRAVIWAIGDSLLRAQSARGTRLPGEYRKLYDERKEYELPRVQTSKAPKGHAHKRASRYVQKRLLRDLWCAWSDVQ